VSPVTVRLLGTGDAFGSGGRFQTCIHIRTDAGAFLIDCGASSLVAMKRAGIEPNDIGAVLSHLHGDHFGGIPFLVLDGQFSGRTATLTVLGPPGTAQRVEEAMEVLFPGSSNVERRFDLRFLEMKPGRSTEVTGCTVLPFEVPHASGAPALALRVGCDEGVVAYSGDCEWSDALVEAARGTDLFICEAYFRDKRVPWHLDLATLRTHLDELDCKRIVLTHMSSDMLRGDVDLEQAHDGLVIEL
jgi:ribonuclease BN (tRNA processing enzyme)